MAKQLANVVEIIAFLSVAVVVIGVFGKWHFLLDLGSHFRVQATLVLVVSSPVLYGLKRRRSAVVCCVVGLGLVASLWPFLKPKVSQTFGEYRLLTMNVLTSNPRHDLAIDYIIESDADFVILQEVNSQWIEALDAALGESWPYRKCRQRSDNFGIAIYSKIPWTTCRVTEYSNHLPTPSITARFRLPNGTDLRICATHLLPPMNHRQWAARNSSLASLAQDIQGTDGERTMVVGDLNCSPWSYWFQRFLRESKLRNSAVGNGLNITWMPIPIAMAGLPIDHVLIGSGITVLRRSVGPYVGSDHRPVVVDFN